MATKIEATRIAPREVQGDEHTGGRVSTVRTRENGRAGLRDPAAIPASWQRSPLVAREAPATDAPTPGVYANVPFDEYQAWDACSASRLSRLARSPAHLRAYLDGLVDDETAAKTSGRLLHTAVLEPERFRASVARGPEGDGRTKAVRDARASLEAAGKTVVMPTEYDRIVAMRERLLTHRTVQQLIERGFSPTELSIVWDADGLTCKARLDLPVPSLGTILDIKTARDARPSEFEKAIHNFGYARQASHYLDGAAVHWPDTFDLFVFVVVENELPHEVAVYELDARALQLARTELDTLRARYRVCIETGEWPGYDPEVMRIGLPAWAEVRMRGNGRPAAA